MNERLRRLRSDETGMTLPFVAVSFLALFASTTLAIDVGMFMNARAQSQNAADAGAHAGAIALAMDDFDNRAPSGPAVQSAVNAALGNKVLGASVAVAPPDVTFPAGTNGEFNRVRVTVYRTAERLNPVKMLIGSIFGVSEADISATATAEAAPANAISCVRPFTIPDKWIENSIPPNDKFERYDNKGKLIDNADEYVPPSTPPDPRYAGYDADRDKGTPLTLRAGSGNNIEPTMYYSWAMPGGTGADFYNANITGCNQTRVKFDQDIVQEPGNMVGPTMDGIINLINQDPSAYWDTVNKVVVSPLGRSPRVFPIPLYDPDWYQENKTNGRGATLRVAQFLGFFVTGYSGNEVYGRITPILGTIDPSAGPAPEGSFMRAIRLVE